MIINIGIWTSSTFGDFGSDLRNTWSNPFINTFLKVGGKLLDQLPAIPVFETFVGVVVIVGAIYYIASRQTAHDDVVEFDPATGEALIG